MPSTITDTIYQDLRDLIRAERPLPVALSLPRLARHYNVSLTPVRLAVNDLLEERLLLKTASGRLVVNPSAPNHVADKRTDREPAEAATLEARLIEEIIRRSLRGNADYLREEAVAQEMGVGRTALRSAFNRLAGQGLLEHVPRCGWRARVFSEKDMDAYLTIRESLELAALEAARPHLRAEALWTMLAGNAPEADGEGSALNNDLHGYLIEKSGNPYIQDFFARNGRYWAALFDSAAPETRLMREMANQHCAILIALLEQDWLRAANALSEHIRAQRPIVRQWMAQMAERAGTNDEEVQAILEASQEGTNS